MTTRVLIIGGYGTFGGYIAKSLAGEADIRLIIGGRNREIGLKFAEALTDANQPECVEMDYRTELTQTLSMRPI